ncbi:MULTISPECIES: RagB/SusD family nutrient uptake outer membrane protein [unclassified Chitinophaga]|uniref:RagB/SusD family nutrient uptake outer membrane protein n=1 Tax=unclassified Chitinophaga TaxID=2619133 RepID=UPI00300FBA07
MKHLRNIFFLVASVASLTLTSCKKWLDVRPKTEIKESEQFSTEQGFKDALYGSYQKAADGQLYGGNLTFSFLEVLSQGYDNTTKIDHDFFYAATYQYSNAGITDIINNIWSNMYATIAQTNYILKNIDSKKSVFTADNYNIIKGEALALRAFIHFDLLRLYAPSPKSDATATAIPYMTAFTVTPQARLTVSEVIALCEKDLKEAEMLLKVYPQMSNPGGNDDFLAFRSNRMNYWAVKALLARLYLYNNNKVQALAYAKEVIASNNFRFITSGELTTNAADLNRTFTPEHIFSIYVSKLREPVSNYFMMATGDKIYRKFTITEERRKAVFETAAGGSTDIRFVSNSLWSVSNGIIFPSKLWQVDENRESLKKRIPVLSLSEMYYIAAESEPAPAEGLKWLNRIRAARNIVELPAGLDAATLQHEIFKEYRRDFICVGQLFYYYKRLNLAKIEGALNGTINNTQYVLPLPNQEIEFGK